MRSVMCSRLMFMRFQGKVILEKEVTTTTSRDVKGTVSRKIWRDEGKGL
jgi:hypothetical protein